MTKGSSTPTRSMFSPPVPDLIEASVEGVQEDFGLAVWCKEELPLMPETWEWQNMRSRPTTGVEKGRECMGRGGRPSWLTMQDCYTDKACHCSC